MQGQKLVSVKGDPELWDFSRLIILQLKGTEQTPAVDDLENAMKSLSVKSPGPQTSLAKDGHKSDCLGAGVRSTDGKRR